MPDSFVKIDFPFSNHGKELVDVQVLYIDDEGHERKKIDKQYNIKELIESQADANTLARVKAAVMAVSPDGANVNPGLLDGIDLAYYPQSMAEMFERMQSYEAKYNSLDPSLKSLFTDKNDFINSIIDGSIQKRLDAAVDEKIKAAKEAAAKVTENLEGGKE
jgi:hypothetical protein